MLPRHRNGQSPPTPASSGSNELGSKNQPAGCSKSMEELHSNTGDGPGIETEEKVNSCDCSE
jgi:hypothetical protein